MQEWKTENGYISTKQIREANFFLSGLLVSRGTAGNQTWKAFSIREGGWILQDRERVRNSIDLHRFTPLYTRSDRYFPRESFLCILAQGEEGERERCRGEDLFPLSSFLSNLLDKYCSYRRDCLLKF